MAPVLAIKILRLSGKINSETAVMLAPAVLVPLGNLRILACKRLALVVGCMHIDLAQLQHTCSAPVI